MKVRRIGIFNQLFLWLAILLLLGNGILGIFVYHRSEDALFAQIQSNAKNIAQCAAANVSADKLVEITIGDEETEAYEIVLQELAFFRDNAELEYIYTLRQVGTKQFEFVVDSDLEAPASIGDECEFTEALETTFLKKMTMADEEAFTDEWGTHVSAYSPILDGNTVVGAVGVDISANWIADQMADLRNLVIIICITVYIGSLLILQLIMFGFKRSMKKLNDKVKELASGSGDLTKEINISTGDELEVIAGNMNEFIRQVRALVKSVAQSTETILLTGEELNTTVNDNTRIMSSMNAEIEGISENMERSSTSSQLLSQNLSKSADDIASFAQNVNEIRKMVQQANENAQEASQNVKENRNSSLHSISLLQEKMRTTSQDAQKIEQIKQIAEEIGKIANQTKMLSLNAQIEAARAGSMGAGFAVVATKVGTLSGEIDQAVSQINEINSEVLSAVGALTAVSEEMIRFVSEDVVKDYDAFANLGEEYGTTTGTIFVQMAEIGDQSTQISQSISDINEEVQSITTVVSATAESANELALSTNQIVESLENLKSTSQQNTLHSEKLNGQVQKYTF